MLVNILCCLTFFIAKDAFVQAINGQPDIVCSRLFSYESYGPNEKVGKLTLHVSASGTHKLRIKFAQTSSKHDKDKFALYGKAAIVQAQLERGGPILYLIRFPEPQILPKLVLVSLDDQVLCRDIQNAGSNRVTELKETLKIPNLSTIYFRPPHFSESTARSKRQYCNNCGENGGMVKLASIKVTLEHENAPDDQQILQSIAGKLTKVPNFQTLQNIAPQLNDVAGKYGFTKVKDLQYTYQSTGNPFLTTPQAIVFQRNAPTKATLRIEAILEPSTRVESTAKPNIWSTVRPSIVTTVKPKIVTTMKSKIVTTVKKPVASNQIQLPSVGQPTKPNIFLQAAIDKAALDKAAMEKAAIEKAAIEKAAIEKAAIEKAAMDKAAKDKAAVDKAAIEKRRTNCGREGVIEPEFPELVPLILGGNDIERGQFPWLAAIKHQNTAGKWEFKCGGTLISARLVLTAAHCLVDVNNNLVQARVDLGRHNIKLAHEANEVYIPTEKLMLHPDYLKKSFPDADVGLVLLKEAVKFTTHVSPICLWSGPNDLKSIVGSLGFVVGWGIDESNVGSALPKMISVPIASELECRKSHPIFFNLLTERTLCAGRLDGSGPLQGDSGGALMMKRDDRWMLRAIVSVGINRSGNDKHTYVIYTDVAKFKTWISNEVNKWV